MHRPSSRLASIGIASALLLGACSSTQPVTVTEAEIGQQVVVTQGGQLDVRLASNRTTGFTWMLDRDGAPLLRSWGASEYNMNPSGVIGEGGTEIFRFTAEQPGDTTIDLAYRRPWEPTGPAARTATFGVRVVPKQ